MPRAKISNFQNLFAILKLKIRSTFVISNQKKYPFYFFILAIFFVIYILIVGQIKSYTKLKENNFNSFLESNEFNNIKEYIFGNLNSPYREYSYIVENNDTIERVLKKYNIENSEINKIASQIVKKKII